MPAKKKRSPDSQIPNTQHRAVATSTSTAAASSSSSFASVRERSPASSASGPSFEDAGSDQEDQSRHGLTNSAVLAADINRGWLASFVRRRAAVLLLLLFSSIIGLLAAQSYFNAQPDIPSCVMSYSRPRFLEQTLFDKTWTRFSTKYKLYLYREGGFDAFDEPYRIPVLFVPGNAGSPKQVRSIASATTSAFVDLIGRDPSAVDRGQVGFDFFTVGLNEEFTALHGYSILEQADFVNDAIRYILSLYPKTRLRHKLSSNGTEFALPTSVVVIGHSMGGVVARTAFTLPNHIVGSIQAIFTLATPHNNPTASLESFVDKVYTSINSFWRHGFHHGTLDDVSLVSIAGGNLDSMINSDYTYVGDLAPEENSLSLLSSGIDDVWLSLDHQSILWCAQMARKFSTMLLHIMDARLPSQLLPLDKRMDVMRRYLYSKLDYGSKYAKPSFSPRKTKIESYRYVQVYNEGAIRVSIPDKSVSGSAGIDGKSLFNSSLHLVPTDTIEDSSKSSGLQIIYGLRKQKKDQSNGDHIVDPEFQVFGCNPIDTQQPSAGTDGLSDSVCTSIYVPAPASLPLKPAAGGAPKIDVPLLKYTEIPADQLSKFAYIGAEIPAAKDIDQIGFFHAQLAEKKASDILVVSPGYQSLLWSYNIHVPEKPSGKRINIRTRIRLNVPENPFFVFRAKLAMRAAKWAKLGKPRFGAVVRQSDGRRMFESKFWYDQSVMDFAIHGRGAYLPSDDIANNALKTNHMDTPSLWKGVYLDIWADTDYYSGFDISLSINWYSSINRMVKRYDMALLALSFIWASLVLLDQLRTWNNDVVESDSVTGAQRRPTFPSCLGSIENLIRNGTLTTMLVAAALTPVLQTVVAYLMQSHWSPALLAAWNNLFMGVRGSGLALCFLPMLLVFLSLGFVALEAVVLTLVCSAISWIAVNVLMRFRSNASADASSSDVALLHQQYQNYQQLRQQQQLSLIKSPAVTRPLVATVAFIVFVGTFVPYQFAFLVIYFAQLITSIRTTVLASHAASKALAAGSAHPKAHAASVALRNRAKYQLALLLFWTSSLPYCAPELLVWVRNLSVMWFEDAPSDHNLLNMAGYFALRMLASYHIVPRLDSSRLVFFGCSNSHWLRCVTYVFFGLSVAVAWLHSVRRPYILYSIANAISAWLAMIQLADFFVQYTAVRRKEESFAMHMQARSADAQNHLALSEPEDYDMDLIYEEGHDDNNEEPSKSLLDRKLR
ncbi:GPI inositol deacylase [Coemansia asiatica]|uniref:GPI inositol-deacylase n=1 Tax=Coemansia asiatica TaxID=1052880 RepID=A0A9W7XQP6_9FUNG|nr:GPI inositol deacylase [Coemansia asiatica]